MGCSAGICRRKDFEWADSLSRIALRDVRAFFSKFRKTMVYVKREPINLLSGP